MAECVVWEKKDDWKEEMKYILLITIIIILIYSIFMAKKNKDLFNPALVFILPIFLSLLINFVYYDKKFQISDGTYGIYWVSVVCFVLGLILGRRLKIFKNESKVQSIEIWYNKTIYKLYWGLAVVGVFFAIKQIIKGQQYGVYGKNLIDNVRHYTQYVQGPTILGKYGIVFADVVMLWLLYRVCILRDSRRKTHILLAVIIIIYNVYMATVFSRTNILYEFIVILFFLAQKYIHHSKTSKNSMKWLIIAGIVIIIMLGVFDFIAQRTNKIIGRSGESWWIFYFGSQFYVFDQNILHFEGRLFGWRSLGIVGRILYKFGLMPMQNIQYYQSVMAGTGNAVTSFVSAPYLDFGIVGSIIVMIFYGITIGYMHKRYLNTGGIWTIVYATCVFQCVLAFYAFVFGGSNQVYDLILLFLLCKVSAAGRQGIKIKLPAIESH